MSQSAKAANAARITKQINAEIDTLIEGLRRKGVDASLQKSIARNALPQTSRLAHELCAREKMLAADRASLEQENQSLLKETERLRLAVKNLEQTLAADEGFRDYAREVRRHREQSRLFEAKSRKLAADLKEAKKRWLVEKTSLEAAVRDANAKDRN
eukprot:SAG31_NODE_16334_length_713_cov_0.889251_1_plen_156_part_01